MGNDGIMSVPLVCVICGAALPERALYMPKVGSYPDKSNKKWSAYCLWECPECRTIFRPGSYEEQNAPSCFARAGFVDLQRMDFWLEHERRHFDYIVSLANSRFPQQDRQRTAVDFGCSFGYLVVKLQACGWNVVGVDIVPHIIEYHRKNKTFPIFTTLDTPEIPDESVDFIAMLDVLDYLHDPVRLLKVAYSKLRSPGLVVLRIQNVNRYLRLAAVLSRWFNPRFIEKFATLYTVYFTKKGIDLAARRAGFKCTRTRYGTGYRYPPMRQFFHSLTHAIYVLTGGLVDFATTSLVEIYK